MSSIVVVIDSRVPYPHSAEHGRSLLAQCLGCGCLLDEVLRSVRSLSPAHLWVLTDFDLLPVDCETLRTCGPPTAVLCKPEALTARLRQMEASDHLIVIEPRYWLIDGLDEKVLRRAMQYGGVTHLIGVGSDEDDARERVDCDSGGSVRRVQRLYGQVLWHQATDNTTVCSLLPVGLMPEASFGSLAGLRTLLASRGVLSQDLPIRSAVVDLADEQGFLVVHERIIEQTVSLPPPPMYSCPSENVMVAADARIDRSARLVPPVIVQSGATIEEGATVIGPAVIGANSRVGTAAVVAQAVVSAGGRISAGGTIHSRVAASAGTVDGETREQAALPLPQTIQSAENADRQALTGMEAGGTGRRAQLAVKRMADVVIAGASLVLLSPLLAAVAVVIKLDSPGPVFFTHRRERRGGRDFPCLKFRTMVADAHSQQRVLYARSEVDGPQFKIRQDPRVTRVGRWLRATNIDELPQLINVLIGHMSLVGPRPSPFRENQVCVPWRRARLSVRPGVTGLWQLCRAGAGDFHQWIYYDIQYVRHFSCWLDFKILVLTVLSLAGRWRVPASWLIRDSNQPAVGRRKVVS